MKVLYGYFPALLLLFSFMSINCGNDDPASAPPETYNPNVITGKIFNWKNGTDKYIIFGIFPAVNSEDVFGKSKINADGSFSVELYPPPSKYLGEYRGNCPGSVFFSDSSAGVFQAEVYIADAKQAYTEAVNDNFKKAEEAGYTTVSFYYADKPFTITGYNNFCYKNVYNEYDIHLKAGWNAVAHELVQIKDGIYYEKFTAGYPEDIVYFYSSF